MRVMPLDIHGPLLLTPERFSDARGCFSEIWHAGRFAAAVGYPVAFVQDNLSRSAPGVLRGLHYQRVEPQGKLVRVVRGRIFDVAVDLRRDSPTFGAHVAAELSDDNGCQLWLPPGFAHGFLVLDGPADVLYKVTTHYHPASEQVLRWNDPALAIAWPLAAEPLLSARDRAGLPLAACEPLSVNGRDAPDMTR